MSPERLIGVPVVELAGRTVAETVRFVAKKSNRQCSTRRKARGQGTITFMHVGTDTWMTPAYEHISLQLLLSAGLFPIITVTEPGIHGPAGAGMHGIGVSTPSAAAVAAATVGFAMLMHGPKGLMLSIGTLSMMVAAGLPPAMVLATGSTPNGDGIDPKLHISSAPSVTCKAISESYPTNGWTSA